MRSAVPTSPRLFRWYASLVCLLTLGSAISARAQTTTITGTVVAPISAVNPTPDPLPNVLVYVAPPGQTPPDINHGGNGISGGCAAQTDLVGLTPVVFTTSDYKGSFTLASPALTALGSGTFNIVIQAGKWRRQFPNTQITAGAINNIGSLNMPSSSAEGDLPKIAVVTGNVDAIECVLRQMGIADSEVTDSAGGGHINLYAGTTKPGAVTSSSSTDTEAGLMTTNSSVTGNPRINDYDLVMFGCQGTPTDITSNNTTGLQNLANYANNGGRVFATHYGYVWLNDPLTFAAAANWHSDSDASNNPSTLSSGTITVNTSASFPEGVILANWLQLIGASPAGTAGYGQLPDVMTTRQDQTGIIAPTQSWGTLNPPYAGGITTPPVMQFSFDTPISAVGAASVSLAFTNTPTNFFEGDPSDTVAINVTNTSTTSASNLTLTLTLPSGVTAVSLQPTNGGSGWVCNIASLNCSRSSSLAAGASDPITLIVSIDAHAPVGNGSISATLSGVSLSGANKCGRVLFNEYHVENPANGSSGGSIFPAECPSTSSGFTPPEKFLEFSLYNLSNFVAPTTTDQILIQGAAVITWKPATTVYYGTPVTDPSIADATSSVPGQFTYTADTTASPIPVGMHTVTLTFTPTDTTDYVTSTQTAQINWVADPTVSTIDSLDTSIFYGEEIGYNNGVDAILDVQVLSPPGYAIGITSGLYTATIDGKDVCHGIEGQPLNPPSGRCDDADFLGWNAGDHKLILTYSGDGMDFLPSVSQTYIVHISPDPTVTTMTTSANPSLNAQPVTLTANVADVYAAPVGPVTFYDSTTPNAACAEPTIPCNYTATKLASVPVTSNNATLVYAYFFTGTHYISACFTPPLNSDGVISNFYISCSASIQQVVILGPSSPLPTQTFLTTSVNPSLVGQLVTFTGSVNTSGAFSYVPTGTLSFFDGTTPIGTSQLVAGTATYATNALALGSHPITAVYSGSTTLAPSTSAVLTQVVTTPIAQAGTGYLLLVNDTTVQVPIGSNGVAQVRIVELNNFNQPIKLTCDGMPAEATCTFATPDIPAAGGTTQLSITAAAPHNCNSNTPYFVTPSGLPLLGLATLTLCLARKRRKPQALALLAMLFIAPTFLTGCGGGNCTDFGVKPNTYTFSITATSQGSPQVVKVQKMTMNAHL